MVFGILREWLWLFSLVACNAPLELLVERKKDNLKSLEPFPLVGEIKNYCLRTLEVSVGCGTIWPWCAYHNTSEES